MPTLQPPIGIGWRRPHFSLIVNRKRHRKRKSQPDCRSPRSRRFGEIGVLIDRNFFSEALSAINAEIPSSPGAQEKAKWLRQVARSLYKRGRFVEAARVFSRALDLAQNAPRDWLEPHLSLVRSLVKDGSFTEAEEAARKCYAICLSHIQNFRERRIAARRQFEQTGRVVVPVKPHRACVVASELGEIFLSEGELMAAKHYFELAIQGNPRGGTRARQGLAEIALRFDDSETAFQRSVEALTLGKFQAKTLASWKPFFAAKRKLRQSGLPGEFLAAIKASQPGVRARAILVVVREMRGSGDPQWKSIAQEWLNDSGDEFPAVAAELRKLFLSDLKRGMTSPDAQLTAARELLETPDLACHEWLAGAKEIVRAALFSGEEPGIPSLIEQASQRFGAEFIPQLCHSLALSCMMANHHDAARPLLRKAISEAPCGTHIWSKSLWALGRMEAHLGNCSTAADTFRTIALHPGVPPRFRLQARLFCAENLIASGDAEAIRKWAEEIPGLLSGITDYDILLNFARQISRSDADLRPLALEIFSRAEALAHKSFAEASHPSIALGVLFKLTRRQIYDFGRAPDVVSFWESMGEEKKLWLWSNNSQWWGYIGFVLMAYIRTGNSARAARLAKESLEDPATPREALPAILLPYYEELIHQGSPGESLEAFRWIVTENPTQSGCASAYYWLALDAYDRADHAEVSLLCDRLLAANPHTEITHDQWMLEAKARLLLADLDSHAIPLQEVRFDAAWLEKARKEILHHLKYLRR